MTVPTFEFLQHLFVGQGHIVIYNLGVLKQENGIIQNIFKLPNISINDKI